ncbi:MAG TPA: hypothetical protein H9903_02475 [Candidatus Aquabacterium excrementipullorum]|nr:hypothetical protein [Candidatus Aquabacterium excrementipullorum]
MITANSNFSLSSALQAYSDTLARKAAAAAGKTSDSDSTSSADKTKTPGTTTGAKDGSSTSGTAGTTGGTKTTTSTSATEQTQATANTTTSIKTTMARQTLDKTQQDLAKALREAITKAGGSLKGEVAFSLDSTSGLKITGSDEDKATISAALKADKSSPSLASRLASLTKSAVTLESNNRASSAISQAARYAKTPAAVMSLYNTLMQQQGTSSTTAVFTLADKTSSLTYKGMVNASA